MQKEREELCEEVLENPLLATPPPEEVVPRPPRVRRPREFKIPPKFELLSDEFYEKWVNHFKQLQMMEPIVDAKPPELFPDMYLKPRRLNRYARQLQQNMQVNKDLLKRINVIQRTGGFVDCRTPERDNRCSKLMVKKRQRDLDNIQQENRYFYNRLLSARSEQPSTKQFDVMWKDTKQKLILGASLPFILFKTEKIDRGIHDPAFDKPSELYRHKVSMDIRVVGGAKIGKVMIELFTDVVPRTCQLFLSLVRGDRRGYAYTGCRIFRIVPGLYCRGGDVEKDNGYGCFVPEGETDPSTPENFELQHSVPGVVSMVVTSENEVTGQFNIIFKPLPQLDGKHVVFGRIVSGPAQFLERISALGLPLGSATAECVVAACGGYSRRGQHRAGSPNTRTFPQCSRKKK